jgi:uncharacterized membrane protein
LNHLPREYRSRVEFEGDGATMAEQGEAFFESRRIEQLSNTIFGVAMTLLAYSFPKEQLTGTAPDWRSIVHNYTPHLIALLLGFLIAGLFWFSHQRRLAYAPGMSRASVLVSLLFLLSIVVLPVTTGLYGAYADAADVVALYACHLLVISLLNLVLWWMAVAARRDWHLIGGAAATSVIFVIAAIVAPFEPGMPRYIWTLGFIAPFIAAMLERRERTRRV